jgi:hypothetical protein
MRHQGLNAREAIFQACLLRFRPILMTTLAALLGALPLMLGSGVGAELRQPLGITMVGGLLVSQVLTLFTTPVIRAQRRPEWLFGCSAVHPLLAAPAAGRLRGGMGVGAPMLRDLTRRGCPSGAAQQQSEFHGAPRNRPAAGLPRSAAQGSQTGGRLSFDFFSWRSKKSYCAAGRTSRHPPLAQACCPISKPPPVERKNCCQPERAGTSRLDMVTPFTINSVAASAYLISARAIKHHQTPEAHPMSLSTPFIHRPIATMLLTLGLALVGAVSYFLLPCRPAATGRLPHHLGQCQPAWRQPRHHGRHRGHAA